MNKTKTYAWTVITQDSEHVITKKFRYYKKRGIDGILYFGGYDAEIYSKIGKISKEVGLEFHAWLPTLIHPSNSVLNPEWYTVNALGESSYDKQPYLSHYKFVCPNRPEIHSYLSELIENIANTDEVDGIHLDYIRFSDVILPKGLWDKYKLKMHKEYPEFDYCYCDKCVNDFRSMTGINIKTIDNPSQVKEWKQFRNNLITNLVNQISKLVHSKNKQISAAVFPGPKMAADNVRQEWCKWNVDALYLMNYNDFYLKGTRWIGKMCKSAAKVVDKDVKIISGLFICPNPKNKTNQQDPEHHGLLPDELAGAIKESIQNCADGICLFRSGSMTERYWRVFENTIHTDFSRNQTD
jgi:uncharacterized lipoprotein YddW (UPF0748 family)